MIPSLPDLCNQPRVVDVITASAAIPGNFPPVVIDGHTYMDGGVVNNASLSHAVDLGADTIYVLSTGYSCALDEPPASALGMTLHAITLIDQPPALDRRPLSRPSRRQGDPAAVAGRCRARGLQPRRRADRPLVRVSCRVATHRRRSTLSQPAQSTTCDGTESSSAHRRRGL
jgi:predicted acylesterase/phospholipase RssA